MNLSTQLRAVLLVVGVALLVAIYFIGRRKASPTPRRTSTFAEPAIHNEHYDEDVRVNDDSFSERSPVESPVYHEAIDREVIAQRRDFAARMEAQASAHIELPPMYAAPVDADDERTTALTVELSTESSQETADDLPTHIASEFRAEPVMHEPVVDSGWSMEAKDEPENIPEPILTPESTVHPETFAHHETVSSDASSASSAAVAFAAGTPQIPTVDESLVTAPPRIRTPNTPIGNVAPTLSEPVAKHTTHRDAALSTARTATAPASAKPASRKLVALRVSSGNERVAGKQLSEAFARESLQHGKFGIFHRMHDGVAVFSVASMVEPGSFDLSTMNEQQFPGVTIFTLLPTSIDAIAAFDQMLDCAQRLTQTMNATLQDERGIKLSPHGIERLREEVLNFQHLTAGVGALAKHS